MPLSWRKVRLLDGAPSKVPFAKLVKITLVAICEVFA
jgi:hypothetical protein